MGGIRRPERRGRVRMEVESDGELAGYEALDGKLRAYPLIDQCLDLFLRVRFNIAEVYGPSSGELHSHRDEGAKVFLDDDLDGGHLPHLGPTEGDGCADLKPADRALEYGNGGDLPLKEPFGGEGYDTRNQ